MTGIDSVAADMKDHAVMLTRLRLDAMPLPPIDADDDKDSRGVVLAVGGSVQVPGAIFLTAVAAMRAGAGKLQIATVRQSAMQLGVALPEALVVAVPQTSLGEIAAGPAVKLLRKSAASANAVVIGPGMIHERSSVAVVRRLAQAIGSNTTMVLDSSAIMTLSADEKLADARNGNVIITPHAGEMATLLELPADEVRANAAQVAQHCAERFGVVVVLKGGETWIANPSGTLLNYRDGNPGLATSGSGDVLAGIIGGLAARGANATTAAAWAVWAHGSAGNKLSRSVGKVGFLASELLGEIPRLVSD